MLTKKLVLNNYLRLNYLRGVVPGGNLCDKLGERDLGCVREGKVQVEHDRSVADHGHKAVVLRSVHCPRDHVAGYQPIGALAYLGMCVCGCVCVCVDMWV